MELTAPKTLERVVSQRALQMGSSFPCQICVVGFFCGVCLTYILLAAMTSLGNIGLGGVSFSNPSPKVMLQNSSADTIINMSKDRECGLVPKDTARRMNAQKSSKWSSDDRASLLYSTWSAMLNLSLNNKEEHLNSAGGLSQSGTPEAPHLENCKLRTQVIKQLDGVGKHETLPLWANRKGFLGLESKLYRKRHLKERDRPDAPYPPWIVGSDEDNFPLTRKVQSDIWIHQHPLNCSDSRVRFLVVDWETLPGFGIGAQLAGMSGLLAIAINEKRVLVTNYFNRADHDGCEGGVRSRWSCYFFPETSLHCIHRALELKTRKEAWHNGIVTSKHNYTSKHIWTGQIPRIWGSPWLYMQPTTEINGSLIRHHRKMDMRWWRAQAVRYLMRFQSEYTCGQLNVARHTAFGMQAAEMVLDSLRDKWPERIMPNPKTDMEQAVWSNYKPWIPRPILSMHVRMGDKACEMKVVEFDEYMNLADRIRRRFPYLNSIWLSTEMQEVVDKSRLYPNWKFYYTNVTRQVGNVTMAFYEESLGRQTSTNYPLTNFLMAAEADFFIGALGSTWCFLIDGMRNTGGKVTAGYLSVNRDRFW